MVTSPILSNIYMDFFDARFSAKYPHLIYTRYSDDMLISSDVWFDYKGVLNFNLQQIGDHVKFLGLNIVHGAEHDNYITVGERYIKDVCLNISQYEKKRGTLKKTQVIGQIEYIKSISERDYLKLLKIYNIKNNRDLDVERLKRIDW